jgi:hypothetical protein
VQFFTVQPERLQQVRLPNPIIRYSHITASRAIADPNSRMHRTSDLWLILRFKLATEQKKMYRAPPMVGAYVAVDSNSGMSNGYDPTTEVGM